MVVSVSAHFQEIAGLQTALGQSTDSWIDGPDGEQRCLQRAGAASSSRNHSLQGPCPQWHPAPACTLPSHYGTPSGFSFCRHLLEAVAGTAPAASAHCLLRRAVVYDVHAPSCSAAMLQECGWYYLRFHTEKCQNLRQLANLVAMSKECHSYQRVPHNRKKADIRKEESSPVADQRARVDK